jgi:predicted nucleic acid-binding protein
MSIDQIFNHLRNQRKHIFNFIALLEKHRSDEDVSPRVFKLTVDKIIETQDVLTEDFGALKRRSGPQVVNTSIEEFDAEMDATNLALDLIKDYERQHFYFRQPLNTFIWEMYFYLLQMYYLLLKLQTLKFDMSEENIRDVVITFKEMKKIVYKEFLETYEAFEKGELSEWTAYYEEFGLGEHRFTLTTDWRFPQGETFFTSGGETSKCGRKLN